MRSDALAMARSVVNDGADLRHHGDVEATPGLVDLAVNTSGDRPPLWLADRLHAALDGVGRYPDPGAAQAALAGLHGIPQECLLLVAGGAEAFTLLAGMPWRRPVVVHPQFTEPEVALQAHGHTVERVLLSPTEGFALGPLALDPTTDLVVIGNPTNPTSRLHRRDEVLALRAPDRLLVVDEAFMDAVEPPQAPEHSLVRLAARTDGVAVIRSLTKTYAIPGLRVGYVVARPPVLRALARRQPHWAVGSLACAAAVACAGEEGQRHAEALRLAVPRRLRLLVEGLTRAGLHPVPDPRAPFVLASHRHGSQVRQSLRESGFAVRRGDTFPGLDAGWLRFAARDTQHIERLLPVLCAITEELDGASE